MKSLNGPQLVREKKSPVKNTKAAAAPDKGASKDFLMLEPFDEGLIAHISHSGEKGYEAMQASVNWDRGISIPGGLGTIWIRGDLVVGGDLRVGKGTALLVHGTVSVLGELFVCHMKCCGDIFASMASFESLDCDGSVSTWAYLDVKDLVWIGGTLTVGTTLRLPGGAVNVTVLGGMIVGERLMDDLLDLSQAAASSSGKKGL